MSVSETLLALLAELLEDALLLRFVEDRQAGGAPRGARARHRRDRPERHDPADHVVHLHVEPVVAFERRPRTAAPATTSAATTPSTIVRFFSSLRRRETFIGVLPSGSRPRHRALPARRGRRATCRPRCSRRDAAGS